MKLPEILVGSSVTNTISPLSDTVENGETAEEMPIKEGG